MSMILQRRDPYVELEHENGNEFKSYKENKIYALRIPFHGVEKGDESCLILKSE